MRTIAIIVAGGWTTGADKCRVTYRYGSNKKANGIGFRLAMSAE